MSKLTNSPPRLPARTALEPSAVTDLAAKVAADILYLVHGEWTDLAGLAHVYEDDWSREDHASHRNTMILRSADGRYFHGTIAVTLTEQTVRTPVADDEPEDAELPGGAA